MTPTAKTTRIIKTGIGLRAPHMADIALQKPAVGFLEAHSENYFCIGGAPFEQLMSLRAHYQVSLHGVGLSLGSAGGVNEIHLQKLKTLADIVEPVLISEHMTWNRAGAASLPDLLPLPQTQEAVDVLCANIDHVQNTLKREILIENPSSYLAFTQDDMSETDMIACVARRTGAKLLLDINNVYVSAQNMGFDAHAYLAALPQGIVSEMHLAGHHMNADSAILIDAHNNPIADPVWELYADALAHFGDCATLIEWDRDIPPLCVLLGEAQKADACRARGRHAHVA